MEIIVKPIFFENREEKATFRQHCCCIMNIEYET